MRTSPEMPFNIGDYLSDTMGLTRAEHGSYCLLIMAYWKNGGPLPNDDQRLRHIALCPAGEWEKTRRTLERFFDTKNGTWRQKRLEEELEKDRKKREAIYRASALGVEARRDLGQLPPVQPPVLSAVERVSREKELGRVEERLEQVKQWARDTKRAEELSRLRDRRRDLLRMLDYKA